MSISLFSPVGCGPPPRGGETSKAYNEKETLKGSPTVLTTALGSWEKPVPRGHPAQYLFGGRLLPDGGAAARLQSSWIYGLWISRERADQSDISPQRPSAQ